MCFFGWLASWFLLWVSFHVIYCRVWSEKHFEFLYDFCWPFNFSTGCYLFFFKFRKQSHRNGGFMSFHFQRIMAICIRSFPLLLWCIVSSIKFIQFLVTFWYLFLGSASSTFLYCFLFDEIKIFKDRMTLRFRSVCLLLLRSLYNDFLPSTLLFPSISFTGFSIRCLFPLRLVFFVFFG